jgi:hypothetical protein
VTKVDIPMEKFYSDLVVYLIKENMQFMIDKIEMPKKHCTVIMVDDTILSTGFNRFKTSQIAIEFGYEYGEYHSELDAIIQVHSQIVDIPKHRLTMINFRLNRFRNLGISRPCSKCISWVNKLFGNFVYTNTFGGLTKESLITGECHDIMSSEELREKFLPKTRQHTHAFS